MNSEDKDFIDKFLDILEPYQKAGIKSVAVVLCFILCFFLGTFLAPSIIKECRTVLPFAVDFYQLSPLEVIYNYLRIGFFFSLFFVFPFFLYQFGKLKIDKENPEDKANLLLSSLILFIIIAVSVLLTYKLIFPFEISILYGLNFDVAKFASSLTAIVSTFILTLFLVVILFLLPCLKFLIKKSLFFNYAILTSYKKTIFIYAALLSALIALPLEVIALALVFAVFVAFYKILVNFAKKRD